jgi:hypothetical protein
VYRIGWLNRRHKRKLKDFDSLVAQCNTWQPPPDTGFTETECWALEFDNPDDYLETMSKVQALDVLIGMHGAGLIHHNFMRPGTAFVEIVPCDFDALWHDQSFQVPAQKENLVFAFKVVLRNRRDCWPSELSRPDHAPDLSTEDWVPGSLLRDQDVSLNVAVIQDILGRIVALKNDKNLYEDMLIKNPGYMIAQQ